MAQDPVAADDGYFNDLSRQPNLHPTDAESLSSKPEPIVNRDEPGLPKQKRVACVICRKRKLKCKPARANVGFDA